MDKYEYKVRADEIKELIAAGEYVQAAEIADTIDWRRVKSVMMLCTISDLYKINRRYEDARDMLLLAYEHRPGGRTICYSLCELSIKMEEYVQAVEYYKEFVQIAPKDSGRYILQYKLYEAQDVSLEERIEVLEELKKRDYREKWAYELAYLYHRVGLATRCVEECDELILWFGEGKYVIKAMELKMLHQPLTPEQQEKYDMRFGVPEEQAADTEQTGYEAQTEYASYAEYPQPEGAIQEEAGYTKQAYSAENKETAPGTEAASENIDTQATKECKSVTEEDLEIHVKTVDVGQFNTMNLQAELAEGLKEVLGGERNRADKHDAITRSIVEPLLNSDTETLDYPEIDEVSEDDLGPEAEQMESSEVFFGETGEIGDISDANMAFGEAEAQEETSKEMPETSAKAALVQDVTGEIVLEQMRRESVSRIQEEVIQTEPPKELAKVLSQETDGQLRLVMPESENLEKQITGQMNIEDILAEWERMKRENEEKRKEVVRQRVLQQTGTMFTEFEASVRDGLLEQLEGGAITTQEAVEEELAEEAPAEETIVEEEAEKEVPVEETVVEEVAEEEAPAEEMVEEEALAEETAVEETAAEGVPAEETIVEESEEEAPAEETTIEESDEVEEIEEIEEVGNEEIAFEEVEAVSEPIEEEAPAEPAVTRDKAKVRSLTREEKELFAPFIQSKTAREQLVQTIDGISLAAYTGNVIITGEEGMDTLTLAKDMIREVRLTDSNFSGKIAKISGPFLNKKDVAATLKQLQNGALIIQKASGMSSETVQALHKALQQESLGVIVVLVDEKKPMNKLLEENPQLVTCFTQRMDVEALSNEVLVAYGKKYAKEREYSIDVMGVLALHTRIEELQTSDHAVTVLEVKDIVDQAIHHANRKTIGHFFDVLFAKRYDEEDMIILSEKDFA